MQDASHKAIAIFTIVFSVFTSISISGQYTPDSSFGEELRPFDFKEKYFETNCLKSKMISIRSLDYSVDRLGMKIWFIKMFLASIILRNFPHYSDNNPQIRRASAAVDHCSCCIVWYAVCPNIFTDRGGFGLHFAF